MREIQHRYITKYVDSFVKDMNLYLVMEYCLKGDLADYLGRCVVRGSTVSSVKRLGKDRIDFNF
jgi:serine/threonine protein kinase